VNVYESHGIDCAAAMEAQNKMLKDAQAAYAEAVGDARSDEDQEIAEARGKADAAVQATRDAEDAAVIAARTKGDAAVDAARDAFDKATAGAHVLYGEALQASRARVMSIVEKSLSLWNGDVSDALPPAPAIEEPPASPAPIVRSEPFYLKSKSDFVLVVDEAKTDPARGASAMIALAPYVINVVTGEVFKSRGDPKDVIDGALPRIASSDVRERVAYNGGTMSNFQDVGQAVQDLLDAAGVERAA